MTRKWFVILFSLSMVLAALQNNTRADHDSEKKKITDRFEVVSFGETQSLKGNALRSVEGMGEYFGYDLDNESVYKKRFDALKLHYNDAREKFKEAGVDTKKEPIYFGAINWNTYNEVLGNKIWEDHKVQFYVAARKKGRKKGDVTVTIENAATGRVLDYGDKDSDRFQVYLEENQGNKFQKWIVPANWQSGGEVGIENAHMDYVLDYNDSKGPFWDEWSASIQSTGDKLNKYQKWRFISAGDGLVVIENVHSGRVLDFHDSGDRKGRVYLEDRKGTRGNKFQRWRIRPVQ